MTPAAILIAARTALINKASFERRNPVSTVDILARSRPDAALDQPGRTISTEQCALAATDDAIVPSARRPP